MNRNLTKVIIVGYPKSGNTWLTRLVAEIIGCPVAGFLNESFNKEVAIEGNERVSLYECYKAHQALPELEEIMCSNPGQYKIIYIYRDPRDVVISSSKFFKVPLSRLEKWLSKNRVLVKIGQLTKCIKSDKADLKYFTNGILYGCNANLWLQTPWRNHVEQYLDSPNIHSISYEELRSNPVKVASSICDFLGFVRDGEYLNQCIERQSFDRRKAEFSRSGETSKAKFMREGRSGAWKNNLPETLASRIERELAPILLKLGYLNKRS